MDEIWDHICEFANRLHEKPSHCLIHPTRYFELVKEMEKYGPVVSLQMNPHDGSMVVRGVKMLRSLDIKEDEIIPFTRFKKR